MSKFCSASKARRESFFYAYNLEKLQFNAIPALFLLNYIW